MVDNDTLQQRGDNSSVGHNLIDDGAFKQHLFDGNDLSDDRVRIK
jgi:hypothetical protein